MSTRPETKSAVGFGQPLFGAWLAHLRNNDEVDVAASELANTLKPLDIAALRASVSKTKRTLVVEEASAHHGLFSHVLRATHDLGAV